MSCEKGVICRKDNGDCIEQWQSPKTKLVVGDWRGWLRFALSLLGSTAQPGVSVPDTDSDASSGQLAQPRPCAEPSAPSSTHRHFFHRRCIPRRLQPNKPKLVLRDLLGNQIKPHVTVWLCLDRRRRLLCLRAPLNQISNHHCMRDSHLV
jgi:hypothetical protein